MRFLLHTLSKVIPRRIKDTNVKHRPLNLLTGSIYHVLILCLYVLGGVKNFLTRSTMRKRVMNMTILY